MHGSGGIEMPRVSAKSKKQLKKYKKKRGTGPQWFDEKARAAGDKAKPRVGKMEQAERRYAGVKGARTQGARIASMPGPSEAEKILQYAAKYKGYKGATKRKKKPKRTRAELEAYANKDVKRDVRIAKRSTKTDMWSDFK